MTNSFAAPADHLVALAGVIRKRASDDLQRFVARVATIAVVNQLKRSTSAKSTPNRSPKRWYCSSQPVREGLRLRAPERRGIVAEKGRALEAGP